MDIFNVMTYEYALYWVSGAENNIYVFINILDVYSSKTDGYLCG